MSNLESTLMEKPGRRERTFKGRCDSTRCGPLVSGRSWKSTNVDIFDSKWTGWCWPVHLAMSVFTVEPELAAQVAGGPRDCSFWIAVESLVSSVAGRSREFLDDANRGRRGGGCRTWSVDGRKRFHGLLTKSWRITGDRSRDAARGGGCLWSPSSLRESLVIVRRLVATCDSIVTE